MNNENQKLSRKRKRRIERNDKINNDEKLLLNRLKSAEKKKKNKKFEKIKQLKILLVNIKYVNTPNKLQPELKELNKSQVIDKILHEMKPEKFDTDEFEMAGSLTVGDQIRQIHIRFRKISDYESYFNAIDQDNFNLVNRSQYGNGCDFNHENVEYQGNNCSIPTKGYCFIKCIIFSTVEDYKDQYLDFIRIGKRRSNVRTMARIQPCLKKLGIDLG